MSDALVSIARDLSRELSALEFAPPVTHVYDPLTYAWAPYESFVRRFGGAKGRTLLVGMNPGPFGMAQTGVPFGEVKAVRDWMDSPEHRAAILNPAYHLSGVGINAGIWVQHFGAVTVPD